MDWLGDHLAGVFLGLAILLGIAEMVSLDLILAMLALGAVVGMIAALLGAGFAVSAIAAAVASVACSRWSAPRWSSGCTAVRSSRLGHGKLVGQQGLVTRADHRAGAGARQGRRRDLDGQPL